MHEHGQDWPHLSIRATCGAFFRHVAAAGCYGCVPFSKPYTCRIRFVLIDPVCLVTHFFDGCRLRPVRPSPAVLPGLRALLTAAEPATGYALMVRAAFRSRSHSKPQRSQRWVRSDSDSAAFTAPHALQVLLPANHGSTFTNCAPYHAQMNWTLYNLTTEQDRKSRLAE